jgi:5-methylcytosine-specific restriction endonuclease McrA
MSSMNKIPRLMRVFVVAVILAILVWKFAAGTEFLYHGIAASALILMGVTFFIYNSSRSVTRDLANRMEKLSEIKERRDAQNAKEIPESENLVLQPSLGGTRYPEPMRLEPKPEPGIRSMSNLTSFKAAPPAPRQDAKEVTAMYFQMAQKSNVAEQTASVTLVKPAQPEINIIPAIEAKKESVNSRPPAKKAEPTKSSTFLREDETTLKNEEKNELLNSVWCLCENPYCKFTKFLDVHHIIDEKDGGDNKLDNLIVLCSFCHDLAHKNEIPEDELRAWIANREERSQFKPNWHYH